ncbi:MAG: hypothetical protein AB1546_10420 [bacterium]
MSKIKDMSLDKLSPLVFGKENPTILFLCRKTEELIENKVYIESIKKHFSGANFVEMTVENALKELKRKIDLVIPVPPYEAPLERRDIEKDTLSLRFRYFIIHETNYDSVRVASRMDMIYRTYFRKYALVLFFDASLLFLVFPMWIIYGVYLALRMLRILKPPDLEYQ